MQVTQTWRIVVLALFPFTVCAQSEQGMAQCVAITNSLDRLACYDEQAISLGFEVTALIVIEPGTWAVSEVSNTAADPSSVTITSTAVSGTSSEGDAISMVIRCRRKKTDLYVRWEDYLGSWAYVRTRVGDDDLGTRQWNLSTDGQSTFYPRGAVNFIENVIEAGRVEFEVTPYVKTAVIVVFDTSELGDAIGPLREACGW
ncbi:MAG: type VI secretion system-associated protein TagO [Gammaproteobacteria bacterium]|nr:type VI secretion system-associated protein TagO [Gammaproteobacteria bacterium]